MPGPITVERSDEQLARIRLLRDRFKDVICAYKANKPFTPLTHAEIQEMTNLLHFESMNEHQTYDVMTLLEEGVRVSGTNIFKNGGESMAVMLA